jgi:excisionase family DNA binding protein
VDGHGSTAAAPDDRVYTVPEVAALLRVHKSTVYRDVESGRITAYRVGKGRGTVRVTGDALHEYRLRAVTRPPAEECAGTAWPARVPVIPGAVA